MAAIGAMYFLCVVTSVAAHFLFMLNAESVQRSAFAGLHETSAASGYAKHIVHINTGGTGMKLRKLCEKDAKQMLEWMHEPTINQYYRFDAANMTIEKAKDFIEKSQMSEKTRHYAVVDDNDEYLGTVSLKEIDEVNKKAEYAIALRKKYHGTGISSLATDEILRIAFMELDMNRIYLNVLENNQRANGFYKKYGFVYEGVFREDINLRGNFSNLAWYSILKSEYLKYHL